MQIKKQQMITVLLGFVFGLLWVILLRFFLYSPIDYHYHANFAVFTNGQREEFDSFTYFEEVSACSQDELNNPKGRAHMHQPESNVVHVHDSAATWGNFFENMGLNLTNSSFSSPSGSYTDDGKGDVVFLLNGQRTGVIANTVIGDEDRLLISYSPADNDFEAEYLKIDESAEKFNTTPDPATCSGSDELTLKNRLKHAISF